ncbi:hypothetical protein K493DRAFT_312621 [Basidiobolus meristosporus CBS 931.73]|uniref:Uncharacterized protein n=1 Tax=Basidiobolus meristosporus CBS 931.73 TaxID=1314790 RepID=A0A1Y1YSB2_9FUNG|nr:hypothetical protein K493DRAFT_312621 [Basidiobolus meristosporus CBS 931.73]|eukprot:ORY00911.1 hypothetical protein K493DRAFT_312621 [Basidiobolus meristosporus CBS 931.73]
MESEPRTPPPYSEAPSQPPLTPTSPTPVSQQMATLDAHPHNHCSPFSPESSCYAFAEEQADASAQMSYPQQRAMVNVGHPTTTESYGDGSFVQDGKSLDQPYCFARPPQIQAPPSEPFRAFKVPCKSREFLKEFPSQYPIPHHMLARDILESDWALFIADLAIGGRLSRTQKVAIAVLPFTKHIGSPGFLISRAIEKRMKSGNINKVATKINMWNYCFFNMRGVHITLWQGERRLGGMTLSDDRSSSSASEEEPAIHENASYRELRTARRLKKKEERSKRKELRCQEKSEQRDQKPIDPFYLLVECKDI